MASGTPTLVGTEPQTPLWLTCLGGGLFLLAGLFLVFRSPPPERAASAKDAPVAAAAPAKPAASAAPRPGTPAGLDPAVMKRLSDQLKPGGAGIPGLAPAGGH